MNINKLYFLYIAKLYTKNVLSVLLGLSFVFTIIDYLNYANEIEGSANQHILYMYYIFQEALATLYPLALVFGVIMTKIDMIKQNTIGALHSFGYSINRIISPILSVALLIYLLFVWLQTTSFAYANEDASSIISGYDTKKSKDLFLKYNSSFVHIDELDVVSKEIHGLTLFETKNNQVIYTMRAKNAKFNGSGWNIIDGAMQRHIYDKNGVLIRYEDSFHKNFATLKGYKPSIMEALNGQSDMKLNDAFRAVKLLETQNIDGNTIKAAIYEKIVFPLFVFGLVVILFFKLPAYSRFSNSALVLSLSIGASLIVWGILIGLGRLGASGILYPEIAYGLPVLLIGIYALSLVLAKERIS